MYEPILWPLGASGSLCMRDLDCVFWIRQPPKVTLESGNFHVCFDVGRNAVFELVMSPNTFLKMRRGGQRVVDEFHASSEVVPLKRNKA